MILLIVKTKISLLHLKKTNVFGVYFAQLLEAINFDKI